MGDLSTYGLQQTILLPSRISGKEIEMDNLRNRWVLMSHGRYLNHLQSMILPSVSLARFLQAADEHELVFEQLPFNQPLFILYSSGTSGKPKCIVHSAGVNAVIFWYILEKMLIPRKGRFVAN